MNADELKPIIYKTRIRTTNQIEGRRLALENAKSYAAANHCEVLEVNNGRQHAKESWDFKVKLKLLEIPPELQKAGGEDEDDFNEKETPVANKFKDSLDEFENA